MKVERTWFYSLRYKHAKDCMLLAIFTLFFCKYEIKLLLFEICLCNLDTELVTKLIGVMATATDKAVVLLVELVVVIVKILDAHHAFAMVLVNLAIYAVACDT